MQGPWSRQWPLIGIWSSSAFIASSQSLVKTTLSTVKFSLLKSWCLVNTTRKGTVLEISAQDHFRRCWDLKSCIDCLLINVSLECIGGDRIVFPRQQGEKNTCTSFKIAFSYRKSSIFREIESVPKYYRGRKTAGKREPPVLERSVKAQFINKRLALSCYFPSCAQRIAHVTI